MPHSSPWLRFLSPLIKPDVPISGIRLSDWLHRKAHDTRPSMQMLCDNTQIVTVFALRYSSHQCRLISMVLIGIRQSPIIGFFESTPEVRVPCSAGITQHQRSYDPVRLPPGPPSKTTLRSRPSSQTGLPRLPASPFRRAVPTTSADQVGAHVDCFPTHAAFPKWPEGRHPHCHFRGLLRLHTRYGPSDCSAAQGELCHEASALPVTRQNRSSATRSIDYCLGGTFLHW